MGVVEFPHQRMYLRFVVDIADFYGNLVGSAGQCAAGVRPVQRVQGIVVFGNFHHIFAGGWHLVFIYAGENVVARLQLAELLAAKGYFD